MRRTMVSALVCASVLLLCLLGEGLSTWTDKHTVEKFSQKVKSIVNNNGYRRSTGIDLLDLENRRSAEFNNFQFDPLTGYFSKEGDVTDADKIVKRLGSSFMNIHRVLRWVVGTLGKPPAPAPMVPPRHSAACGRTVPGLAYDMELKIAVARNASCVIYNNKQESLSTRTRQLLSHVGSVIQDHENSAHWRSRQIIAFHSLDGDTVFYPSINVTKADIWVPQRQWLGGTLHPIPKDVVIIIDVYHLMAPKKSETTERTFHRVRRTINELMSTLSTRDRIAIVAAIPHPTVPPGRRTGNPGGCMESKMAFVTNDILMYLTEFMDVFRLGNVTNVNVSRVFQRAFRYFKNDVNQPVSHLPRERIMLTFMASRKLAEAEYITALDTIHDALQQMLNKRVMFLGIALNVNTGEPLVPRHNFSTDKLLRHLSNSQYTRTTKESQFRDVLEGTVKWFHSIFYHPGETTTIASSFPKLGPTVHSCSHAKVKDTFVGLVCVIVPTADLESDMDFPEYMASYGFILDGSANLILYPSLIPTQTPDSIVRIQTLEPYPEFTRRLPAIIRQATVVQGSRPVHMTIVRNFTTRLGQLPMSSGHSYTVSTNYTCSKIRMTDLTFCGVFLDGDARVSNKMGHLPVWFPYHRFDLRWSVQTCSYYGFEVLLDSESYMLTAKAFNPPSRYPESHQSEDFAKNLVIHMQEEQRLLGDLNLKEEVQPLLSYVVLLTSVWKTISRKPVTENSNDAPKPKWYYAGFISGIFAIFPGVRNDDSYDHTTRPWYILAMSRPAEIVFTKPYQDYGAGENDYVISICKALNITRANQDDFIIGIMCLDYTPGQFQAITYAIFADMCKGKTTCFFADNTGHILSEIDFGHDPTLQSTHLTDKERWIAHYLIKENILKKIYCTDVSQRKEKPVWEIDLGEDDSLDFADKRATIHHVANTNSYIIVVRVPINSGTPQEVCDIHGCDPPGSYKCTCSAPVNDCDQVYNRTSTSRFLRFCPSPIYNENQNIAAHKASANLKKCHVEDTACPRNLPPMLCKERRCRVCPISHQTDSSDYYCEATSLCDRQFPTLLPILPVNEPPVVAPVKIQPNPQRTMSTLTICLSITVCILFVISVIAIAAKWPSHVDPHTTPDQSVTQSQYQEGSDLDSARSSTPTTTIVSIESRGSISPHGSLARNTIGIVPDSPRGGRGNHTAYL